MNAKELIGEYLGEAVKPPPSILKLAKKYNGWYTGKYNPRYDEWEFRFDNEDGASGFDSDVNDNVDGYSSRFESGDKVFVGS